MHSLRALNIQMVTRTFDYEFIKRIVTDPENYYYLVDDGSASASEYEPLQDENIYYLMLGEEEGVAMFFRTNHIAFDMHVCMAPECRGKRAFEYGKQAIKWLFDNTVCEKVNAKIPIFNKKTLHYATAIGFVSEGTDRKGFMKDGVLYDQHILGITRN